jgi:hypothetical protein
VSAQAVDGGAYTGRTVKAQLSRDQELIHPPIQKSWGDALKGGS